MRLSKGCKCVAGQSWTCWPRGSVGHKMAARLSAGPSKCSADGSHGLGLKADRVLVAWARCRPVWSSAIPDGNELMNEDTGRPLGGRREEGGVRCK